METRGRGVLAALARSAGLAAGLYAAYVLAEPVGLVLFIPGPFPESLGPTTLLALRSSRWASDPLLACALILNLPMLAALVPEAGAARALLARRIRVSRVWIGPLIFVIGLGMVWAGGFVVLGWMIGLVALLILAVAGYAWATRRGLPAPPLLICIAALAGLASGALYDEPDEVVPCRPGAEVRYDHGRSAVCVSILPLPGRTGLLVRREDGGVVAIAKARADGPSFRAAVARSSFWFDGVAPVE